MGSLAQASSAGFIGVPTDKDRVEWEKRVTNLLNLTILQGKLNCTGEATLLSGASATTISDARVASTSVILPMPLSATAAAALAVWYVAEASLVEGSFVLSHVSTSTSDCVIHYAILG